MWVLWRARGARRVQHATGAGGLHCSGKTLFREIQPNNWSIGASIGRNKHPSSFGTVRTNDIYGYIPFTVSLNDDRQFVHINIGATKRQLDDQFLRTWGLGIEYQLTTNTFAMAESFGETRSTPL